MNEKFIKYSIKKWFEKKGYLAIPEFGIKMNGVCKRTDLASFKWKDERDIEAIAVECKCIADSREGCKKALGQATNYQPFFPSVYIGTQEDEYYFKDEDWILSKLGLGRLMVNGNGEVIECAYPNHELFEEKFLKDINQILQVRDKGIISLTFCEIFPQIRAREDYFGGKQYGGLWIQNRQKDEVHFRAYSPPYTKGTEHESYFGINIQSVHPIRNILRNVDINQLHNLFSSLPDNIMVWIGERPTKIDRRGFKIVDRQKEASIPIKNSIFYDDYVKVSKLTKRLIEKEILDKSKKLDGFAHLLIDSKLWKWNENLTKREYHARMHESKEIMSKLYKTLDNWSK